MDNRGLGVLVVLSLHSFLSKEQKSIQIYRHFISDFCGQAYKAQISFSVTIINSGREATSRFSGTHQGISQLTFLKFMHTPKIFW